jgi:hypothetical protein
MFGTGTNGVLVAEAQLVQGLIRVLGAEISDLLYFHRKRQKVGRNRRLDNKAKLSPCILCASRRRRDMPYRDLVNQAKHTAQAWAARPSCRMQMVVTQQTARVASHTLQLGQVLSGAFLRSHFKPKTIC